MLYLAVNYALIGLFALGVVALALVAAMYYRR